MNVLADPSPDCWSRIGIYGDRSCVDLEKWSVCPNCPIFVEAGKALFDVAPPADYLSEWSDILASNPTQNRGRLESVVIFRVQEEWLALRTAAFVGVDEYRRPRPVPHRTNKIFLGLVSVEGRIHLAIDMGEFLGIPKRDQTLSQGGRPKLMIIEIDGQSVAFSVREVLGVFRFDDGDSTPPPSTLAKALPSFTERVFNLDGKQVGLLDAARILHHLRASVLA